MFEMLSLQAFLQKFTYTFFPLIGVLSLAPFAINHLTQSVLPDWHDMCKGVAPSYLRGVFVEIFNDGIL